MARKKIISLAMAALMTVGSLWDASPAFYESIVAKAGVKAEEQTEEEVVAEATDISPLLCC